MALALKRAVAGPVVTIDTTDTSSSKIPYEFNRRSKNGPDKNSFSSIELLLETHPVPDRPNAFKKPSRGALKRFIDANPEKVKKFLERTEENDPLHKRIQNILDAAAAKKQAKATKRAK
jgi:hypothetical protein